MQRDELFESPSSSVVPSAERLQSATWIEHLGHTSFLVARGGLRVLIDPIVARQDLDFRAPTCPSWFYGDLERVDAIFISHGHNDHLHPPSLLGFPPDVTIYFLDEDPLTCSCDEDPRELLAHLGFRDIRPFRPGDSIHLHEDVTIHILPAQSSSEGEEQVCFLIETPEALVLDAVDIKDAPATRASLEPFRGKVDLAFVPTGAALQFQGFWNQMDTMEALAFCQWLEPRQVATCGGSLSLARRPRMDSLERYPKDFADWLAAASRELGEGQVLHQRPPFRLEFGAHRILRAQPLARDNRYEAGDTPGVRPLLTAFFCGYDPRRPTQRLTWVDSSLAGWLGSLRAVREAVRAAEGELSSLVERCHPALNQTPAGVLAPSTLRHLWRHGEHRLAGRLSACFPEAPQEPGELELSFFAVVESLVESWPELSPSLRRELRICLWIDRRVFQLRNVHIQLRQYSNVPEERARELLAQHLTGLRATVAHRRPVLGPHHFRLTAEQAPLWTGKPLQPGQAGVLAYASPSGVHCLPLSETEAFLLDRCDGRTFEEIAGELSAALDMPRDEVEDALFGFLGRLTRSSVLLVDWSQ